MKKSGIMLESLALQTGWRIWQKRGLTGLLIPVLIVALSVIGTLPVPTESGSRDAVMTSSHLAKILYGDARPPAAARTLSFTGDGEGTRAEIDSYAEFQLLPPHPRHLQTTRPQGQLAHPGWLARTTFPASDRTIESESLQMAGVVKKLWFGFVKSDDPARGEAAADAGLLERLAGPSPATYHRMPVATTREMAPGSNGFSDGPFAGSSSLPIQFTETGSVMVPLVGADLIALEEPESQTAALAPELAPGDVPILAPETAQDPRSDKVTGDQPVLRGTQSPAPGGEAVAKTAYSALTDPDQIQGPGPATVVPGGLPKTGLEAPATAQNPDGTSAARQDNESNQPLSGFVIPATHVASGIPLARPESVASIASQGGIPLLGYVQRPEVMGLSSRSPAVGRINRTVRNHATREDVWHPSNPQLLAIIKRENRYSALILMPDGTTQHVRRGSSFNGGRMSSITTHEAVYTKDGKKHTLQTR